MSSLHLLRLPANNIYKCAPSLSGVCVRDTFYLIAYRTTHSTTILRIPSQTIHRHQYSTKNGRVCKYVSKCGIGKLEIALKNV